MSKPLKMLAFDFGASGGKAFLGILNEGKLTTEEIHRFSNDPVMVRGHFYWDVLRLFHEIKQGLIKCATSGHKDIDSIAIDTWGVDFGLLDEKGELLGNPYHYRDTHTDGMMEEVFKVIPKDELYSQTGIQFMQFNSIYQLYAMKKNDYTPLKNAKTLLFMPDLLNYFLTGVKTTEYSIASTSQLLDPVKRDWNESVFNQLDLPRSLFTEIIKSGTVVGKLSADIAKETGLGQVDVIAVAAHDTGSAVVSVPALEEDFVYISCGTWSLLGVESDEPIVNDKSYDLSYTNEGGAENKIRFLKNIIGLWLVQECKRQWEREGQSVSFAELEQQANEAKPFESLIDPDCEMFLAPGDMPERIRQYCRNTNQPVPETKGAIVRCIMESLAMKYRATIEGLEGILGKNISVIHMVGGGIKDKMLCQFTANATARQVITGPIEATAIGNIMVQAMALNAVDSLSSVRKIVKASYPTTDFEPQNTEAWEIAYKKFLEIVK